MNDTFQLKTENCKIYFEVPPRLEIVVSAVCAVKHLVWNCLRRRVSSYFGANLVSVQPFVCVQADLKKKKKKKLAHRFVQFEA